MKSFRDRWLNKATKITGKSLDYICYSQETYMESVAIIRNSGCIKPNRIVNKLRDYKKGKENKYEKRNA